MLVQVNVFLTSIKILLKTIRVVVESGDIGIGGRHIQMANDQSAIEPKLPPLSFLLAEDNVINQKVAVALLTRYGHQVVVAQDGIEALRAAESGDFDAILMDVQMPVLDGYSATRQLRRSDRFTKLPIIAMTAGAGDEDAERCLAAGMDGHVGKPFDTRKIFALLEQCLRNRRLV